MAIIVELMRLPQVFKCSSKRSKEVDPHIISVKRREQTDPFGQLVLVMPEQLSSAINRSLHVVDFLKNRKKLPLEFYGQRTKCYILKNLHFGSQVFK